MSRHIHIGDCTTPVAISLLTSLYHCYIHCLYRLGQENERKRIENSGTTLRVVTDSEHTKSRTRSRCIRIWQRGVVRIHP